MPESTSQSGEPVTFINVFEVPREDLDAFKGAWEKIGPVMASAPGFRGAVLHEAISDETRFQLVNVAHWDSEQAWRDAAADPEMRAAAGRMGADPAQRAAVHNIGLYRPVVSFGANS